METQGSLWDARRGGGRAEVLESVRGVLIDEFGFDVVVAGEIFAGSSRPPHIDSVPSLFVDPIWRGCVISCHLFWVVTHHSRGW
jgi:hypothetical protein